MCTSLQCMHSLKHFRANDYWFEYFTIFRTKLSSILALSIEQQQGLTTVMWRHRVTSYTHSHNQLPLAASATPATPCVSAEASLRSVCMGLCARPVDDSDDELPAGDTCCACEAGTRCAAGGRADVRRCCCCWWSAGDGILFSRWCWEVVSNCIGDCERLSTYTTRTLTHTGVLLIYCTK